MHTLCVPLDETTPVIVGVGQVTNRPSRTDDATWTEPLDLMGRALELALVDATGGSATSALRERIDEIAAIPSFVWHVPDPARLLAARLGIEVAATRLAYAGGTTPQTLLFDAARRISRGELDVAVIVGAEAMRTRDLARRAGAPLSWATDPDREAAPLYGEVPDALTDHERAVGLALPVTTYALFEHARRGELGMSRETHLASLGALAATMSEIASSNPNAWITTPAAAAATTSPSPTNRMVSTPYTKLLTSNVIVDMGAAVVVCSLAAARRAGVPDDQLVFPHSGAVATEQWFVSTRRALGRSVAMGACARAVLGGPGIGSVDLVDLYSCFPIAVQMACDVLGLDPVHGAIAPSVTGGMTFFGGPGNNYVTHSLATMADALRRAPGAVGLVTALGWYASTHAWGTYSTTPPPTGFRAAAVQGEVDAVALCVVDDGYVGRGVIESYTVGHARDGGAERAVLAVRTPSGSRRLAVMTDPSAAAAIEAADPLGAPAVVSAGGSVELD